jgi:PleD family two-component response regulator
LRPQTAVEARVIDEHQRRRVVATVFLSSRNVGVTVYSETLSTAAAIIRAADQTLYEAKRGGRYKVRILDDKQSDYNDVPFDVAFVKKH